MKFLVVVLAVFIQANGQWTSTYWESQPSITTWTTTTTTTDSIPKNGDSEVNAFFQKFENNPELKSAMEDLKGKINRREVMDKVKDYGQKIKNGNAEGFTNLLREQVGSANRLSQRKNAAKLKKPEDVEAEVKTFKQKHGDADLKQMSAELKKKLDSKKGENDQLARRFDGEMRKKIAERVNSWRQQV